MATDQSTDATAARLLDAVIDDAQAFMEYWQSRERLPEHRSGLRKAWPNLDTLIRYHRAAGAVEALAEMDRYLTTTAGVPNSVLHRSRLALAAAQERLAAYEEAQ